MFKASMLCHANRHVQSMDTLSQLKQWLAGGCVYSLASQIHGHCIMGVVYSSNNGLRVAV